jgi:hypothetical protein
MPDSKFLCLAVARRAGGNCIAGIDVDSGRWIRPVNPKTHGAYADHETIVVDAITQEQRMLEPLDLLQIHLEKFAGNNVQPENWEMSPAPYDSPFNVIRRFVHPQDADLLLRSLQLSGPLLHTRGDKIPADDPSLKRGLSRSLSLIRPDQLHWKVAPHPTYPNRLRIQADFRFAGDPYCLVVTDPLWESQCKRLGSGRHPHSAIAGPASSSVLLAISLAETPLNGYHYKLAAGVVALPV